MDLLIATTNPGKAREFSEMLRGQGVHFSDLSALRVGLAVEESGKTFRANACLKATEYARRANRWTVADDSGLEVEAMAGKPGVLSARWAQSHGRDPGDAANNALLLQQLMDISEGLRIARFVCVLALADPLGRIAFTARGTVEGRIGFEARGQNGFGYDPLLVLADGRHIAELPAAEKNAISHRGKALRQLRELMERWMG